MLDSSNLMILRNTVITDFLKSDLVDLRDVNIDTEKALSKRITDYFEQIKNPYLFRIGDMSVKISFCSDRSFTDALSTAISNGTNYQSNLC